MKTFALAALAGVSSATITTKMNYEFMKYIQKFEKMYNTVEEFEARRINFKHQMANIEAQNARYARGESSYQAGLNQFSDWHDEEFQKLFGHTFVPHASEDEWTGTPNDTTTGLDWRTAGTDYQKGYIVTAVKDQRSCGASWAFSATETTESWYVLTVGDRTIVPFSEQQLLDCSTNSTYGNSGCNGGRYTWAWDYNKTNRFMRDYWYSYTGAVGTCQYQENYGLRYVWDYGPVAQYASSIKAILERSPVSAAVAANNDVFKNYASGIVTEADNCPTDIDHAVQLVGWGYENDDPDDQGYFIVRNSWNTTWGEAGYIRLGMADGKGICGVNQDVYWNSIYVDG